MNYLVAGSSPARSCSLCDSSNVIEKCLRAVGEELSAAMIAEMCTDEAARALCKDQYGNYVIQCAVEVADAATGHMLIKALGCVPRRGPALAIATPQDHCNKAF